MSAKHRGWALFFAAMFGAIALFIRQVVKERGDLGDSRGVWAIVFLVLLVAARFAYAAITGRVPAWMEELFDNPD